MRTILVNLSRAVERRKRMEYEFRRVGLSFEIWPAVDCRNLTKEDRSLIDQVARRRLGLYPISDGSLANTLSQRAAMRDLVVNGPEVMAVFEDDAKLTVDVPAVLKELERRPDLFDIAILQRRSPQKKFVPTVALATGHTLGRVRFSDYGSNAYVITRSAARDFLSRTPRMVREIDQTLSRFWENGLNVLYVYPAVVTHGDEFESQIEESRLRVRFSRKQVGARLRMIAWRLISSTRQEIWRRIDFRRLIRSDRKKFGAPPRV